MFTLYIDCCHYRLFTIIYTYMAFTDCSPLFTCLHGLRLIPTEYSRECCFHTKSECIPVWRIPWCIAFFLTIYTYLHKCNYWSVIAETTIGRDKEEALLLLFTTPEEVKRRHLYPCPFNRNCDCWCFGTTLRASYWFDIFTVILFNGRTNEKNQIKLVIFVVLHCVCRLSLDRCSVNALIHYYGSRFILPCELFSSRLVWMTPHI